MWSIQLEELPHNIYTRFFFFNDCLNETSPFRRYLLLLFFLGFVTIKFITRFDTVIVNDFSIKAGLMFQKKNT